MRTATLIIAALALTACRGGAAETALTPPQSGVTCNANAVQDVVGKPRSPQLADSARRRAGAKMVRYLMPGQMTTMEYRGDRLNLHLDGAGKVARVNCG